MISGYADFHVA